jgi:hypothetical protein
MQPTDAAIVETLQRRGPSPLDDVVSSLSIFSWGEVFDSVERLSRDGRVLLSQLGYSTYQLSLVPQSHASSRSVLMGGIPSNMANHKRLAE